MRFKCLRNILTAKLHYNAQHIPNQFPHIRQSSLFSCRDTSSTNFPRLAFETKKKDAISYRKWGVVLTWNSVRDETYKEAITWHARWIFHSISDILWHTLKEIFIFFLYTKTVRLHSFWDKKNCHTCFKTVYLLKVDVHIKSSLRGSNF